MTDLKNHLNFGDSLICCMQQNFFAGLKHLLPSHMRDSYKVNQISSEALEFYLTNIDFGAPLEEHILFGTAEVTGFDVTGMTLTATAHFDELWTIDKTEIVFEEVQLRFGDDYL